MVYRSTRSDRKKQAFIGLLFAATAMAKAVPARSFQHNAFTRRSNTEMLPYRDASLSVDERVDDLIQRMTLEEKAGQLFQNALNLPANGSSTLVNTTVLAIEGNFQTHFNLAGAVDSPRVAALWHNNVQQSALNTRLGIPVTMSSDPRNSYIDAVGSQIAATAFSQWPGSLGLAALRDASLVKKFANIVRQEYLAIGLRSALHPQVDLSTEPRWARIGGTMGEDANLTAELVVAYIQGFTGDEFGNQSVTTVTKHFPGSGPVEDGEDSHFTYGKNATYPGNNFEHHLIPFKAAIKAGARQIMPYYSRPMGTKYEEVASGMNKGIVTDLLRNELGFDGIVVTDWGLVTDGVIRGQDMPARAWGAENLTEIQRAEKILNAGADQFGGEKRVDLILQLVGNNTITEDRIDISVRRLLREKFLLGLFENPFVDVDAADKLVNTPEFNAAAQDAQRKSFTLLTNNATVLPLKHDKRVKFYTEGLNTTLLAQRKVTVVATPEEADIALIRLQAPYEPRPGGFEKSYHAGSLEYNVTERARQAAIYSTVPTIVDIFLDRPAAIPEIAEQAKALMANYGASGEAFLDVVFGADGYKPQGKLPFDLPRSMEAVEASNGDVPFDTVNPVFRFGHGLSYEDC
ncbi:glycoside hydrolase family 3 protein [Didymella exigua CBS 183.55]|uniref:beta-glucosidase n=1 Tax=Didymella exigua CBS 183.55 TaxID=1150837 RepID=A0A6A5RQ13_9PLEO|nr:glycoside hydrolase family 3 protein [Didymella exigua CBS 183.55]KAF1930425.1 glycoside hydrolase family 3 protein [Didymella exigua CBS 183.55]